jgi:hypothetical protein
MDVAYESLPPSLGQLARENDRAARNASRIGGSVLMLLGSGVALYVLGYTISHGRTLHPRAEELVPILIGFGVAFLGRKWWKTADTPDDFLIALRKPGVEVLWAYLVDRTTSSRRYHVVQLGLSTGDLIAQDVNDSVLAERILREIEAYYDGVVVGYSEARERAFRAAPRGVTTA